MARLPAEHFSCKIDIELDIPYSKMSVCRPLRLEAVVGVHKLHIQSNIKVSKSKYIYSNLYFCFGSRSPGLNSALYCIMLHCIEPFIITPSLI